MRRQEPAPPVVSIALVVALLVAPQAGRPSAQVELRAASDRDALRAWFLLLVDAQFYRPTSDVTDCAGLIRRALREALRPHTPEWLRHAKLPLHQLPPDILDRPRADGAAMRMFLVRARPPVFAEFADSRTIVRLNAAPHSRDVAAARPGDLLYFSQPGQSLPDHLMVFVGPTATAPEARDWVVYHTGPQQGRPGEVRKARLADLLLHPSPHWRPSLANDAFMGVYRLHLLS